MKSSKFLPILYILTFLFVLIGSTFAYFTTGVQSNTGAIAANSARVGIKLLVEPLYVEKALIPMNDDDVMKAYAQRCIDDNDYGACQAYTITVENIGEELEYNGTINFSMNHITNLNYLILDENDEVYNEKTIIEPGTNQSLGEAFTLTREEKKVFKLIIWVPNFDYDQNDDDGSGNFNAIVTYKSAGDYQISGSITGN